MKMMKYIAIKLNKKFHKETRDCLLVCIWIFLAMSCGGNLRKENIDPTAKALLGKTLVFSGNEESNYIRQTENSKYTLVSYIDSSDCTPCALQRIDVYKLYKDQLKNQFYTDILLIVQNTDRDAIENLLSEMSIRFPFLLDPEKKFKTENGIPDKPIYQTFIINEKKEIIWVGSPVETKESWTVYKKMMNILLDEK
jgi:hypothetical protein